MGVTGLWKLIDGAGKQVTLESLEGKIYAVDASILLNQALKGMKNQPNAHLHVLFLRLCKLLTYKIKPIFVFDGGVPILKRQTIAARQQRRDQAAEEAQSVSERLKRKAVQKLAIDGSLGKAPPSKQAKKATAAEPDLFELPPLPQPLDTETAADDYYELPIHSMLYTGEIDLQQVDVNSEGFKSLPLEYQHEILEEVKEYTKHNAVSLAKKKVTKADDFSSFQIDRIVKSNRLTNQIEGLRKEMLAGLADQAPDDSSSVLQANRVMSEDTTHYLLLKTNPNDTNKSGFISSQHTPSTSQQSSSKPSTSREPDSSSVTTTARNQSVTHDAWCVTLSDEDDDVAFESAEAQRMLLESMATGQSAVKHSTADLLPTVAATPWKNNAHLAKPTLHVFISDSDSENDRDVTAVNPQLHASQAHKQDKTGEQLNVRRTPIILTENEVFRDDVSSPSSKSPCHDMTASPDTRDKFTTADQNSSSMPMSRPNISTVHGNLYTNSQHDKLTAADSIESSVLTSFPNVSTTHGSKYSHPVTTTPASEDKVRFGVVESKDIQDKITTGKGSPANRGRIDTVTEILDSGDEESDGEEVVQTATAIPLKEQSNADDTDKNQPPVIPNPVIQGLADEILQSSDRENLQNITQTLQSNHAELQTEYQKQQVMAQAVTQQMVDDAVELLRLFGIPYVISPSEAEAQCAKLEELGLCNGVITEDSDVWLFGASCVLKNFFQQDKFVVSFNARDILRLFGLDREKFIALALVCGSDYTSGIANAGPVTAIEIISEFGAAGGGGIDALKSFRSWLSDVKANNGLLPASTGNTSVRNKLRKLLDAVPESFPNHVIIDAYMKPSVDDSNEAFEWGRPDLDLLRQFAHKTLNWTSQKVDDLVCPVIKKMNSTDTQSKLGSFFNFHGSSINTSSEFQSNRLKSAISKLVTQPLNSQAKTESKSEPEPTKPVPKGNNRSKGVSKKAPLAKPKSTARGKKSKSQPKKSVYTSLVANVNNRVVKSEVNLSEDSDSD